MSISKRVIWCCANDKNIFDLKPNMSFEELPFMRWTLLLWMKRILVIRADRGRWSFIRQRFSWSGLQRCSQSRSGNSCDGPNSSSHRLCGNSRCYSRRRRLDIGGVRSSAYVSGCSLVLAVNVACFVRQDIIVHIPRTDIFNGVTAPERERTMRYITIVYHRQ